jgi:hypothetical protein
MFVYYSLFFPQHNLDYVMFKIQLLLFKIQPKCCVKESSIQFQTNLLIQLCLPKLSLPFQSLSKAKCSLDCYYNFAMLE